MNATSKNNPLQRRWYSPALAAIKVLGYLATVSSTVNLVAKFAGIGLLGIISEIIAQYEALRDFLLAPIVYTALAFHWNMSEEFRDALALYLLLSSSLFYTVSERYRDDQARFRSDPIGFERDVRLAAQISGKDPSRTWDVLERGLRRPWRNGLLRNVASALLWPGKLSKNIIRSVKGNEYEKRQSWTFTLRLLVVALGVTAFFFVSYFESL